jgi:hypothetical protein
LHEASEKGCSCRGFDSRSSRGGSGIVGSIGNTFEAGTRIGMVADIGKRKKGS